jgi:hypothetical protein
VGKPNHLQAVCIFGEGKITQAKGAENMRTLFVAVVILCAGNILASDYTKGINGIHSDVLPLDGTGVNIGQIENTRPGKPGFDDPAGTYFKITPTGIYFIDQIEMTPNRRVDLPPSLDFHAEWVAGIMISKDDIFMLRGVSPEAKLYAAAVPSPAGTGDENFAVAHRILLNRTCVRSI